MNFNFNETAGAGARVQLEGNAIYEVTFDGCEARDFAGQQDPSKQFHVLELKFHNKDGYFTDTIWEPQAADAQDREGAFGKQPSNIKVMMYKLKHLIDAVNPELGKKIDSKEEQISASSWDELRKFMVDNTAAAVGSTTKIKLVKNNKGDAMFPYFLNYNRNNELYMSTNFIGKGVFFTTKELDKIKKASATPTPIHTSNTDMFTMPETATVETKTDEFDMNI